MGQCATDDFGKSSEYEKLCWAISELEKSKKLKNSVNVSQNVNLQLQHRLIKLIGEKPLFNCEWNDVESRVLWDTGSMISLVDVNWVKENTPNIELRPISDFIEEEKVEFKAANNTDVVMLGSVVLKFTLGENCFPVPFLVTNEKLLHPILGYNVIEYLISSGVREDVVMSLKNSASDIAMGKINVLVNLISQNFEDNNYLGELVAPKTFSIPPNSTVRIRCKVKGDVKGQDFSVICTPPVNSEWDDTLEVTESLGELVRGRTPHVNIEIRNTSGKEKNIYKNMVLGEINTLSAVIPIKLFKTESEKKIDIDVLNTKECKNKNEK